MSAPGGEMPFLDHLEELRARLIRSIIALLAGFVVGFLVVQQFQLVAIMKRPIEPYLPAGGRLVILSPTDAVMIVFKLSFLVGLVLAAPVVLWQTWAFLAPALYAREKKVIVPALFVGSLLFLVGAVLAWVFVLPQTLRVLFSFQTEALAPMITYQAYFDFLVRVVLALGISFELPLLIVILAWLGVATPARLSHFRRFAIVLACVGGAILSPGGDLISMVMFTIPLIVLYEIGYGGAVLLDRRRRRRQRREAASAALLLLLACVLGTGRAESQVKGRPPADTTAQARPRADTTAKGRPRAEAAVPGIPSAAGDSILEALLARPGYRVTRYRADSATLLGGERRFELRGNAHTEREGMTLDAGRIGYDEDDCLLTASGRPRLVDEGRTLLGESIRYDTCERKGMVRGGETQFEEGGTVWFLRGNVQQDSSSTRIFAGASEITSCPLPAPHYRFAVGKIKWVSNSMIVARPVVLYIRDVPVLWLPFIFQDTRPGRRSGILVPKLGINDIVRTSDSYHRQITNIGYYWAPSEYLDFTGRLDWYSGRYLQVGVETQYRFLDRFMDGTLGLNRQFESGGGNGFGIRWAHRQNFNISTSLNLDVNYLTNSTIVEQNALDPLINTQQITSSANFTKRFGWGSIALGGNRRQNLSDRSWTSQLPSLTVSPKPVNFGRSVTWSPGLSLVNNESRSTLLIPNAAGGIDTVEGGIRARATNLGLETPLRIGAFNWRNSLSVVDQTDRGRVVTTVRRPNLDTPDPNDSLNVSRITGSDFSTGLNWDTGINLPILFRNTWKIQPAVGITNATSGFFGIRNARTGGAWVFQGKRPQLSATMTPTFFGRFGGIGPLTAIRHAISPTVRWSYSPAADVSEEFANAVRPLGSAALLRSDPTQRLSISLSQTFEGKGRPQAGDSLGTTARKYRILSISTSELAYDFEQAKLPGRTGWTTRAITNSVLSDLLPGFNLNLSHDLWRGAVGSDTAEFAPFLQNVSANFSLSERTFRAIGSFFGLGSSGQEPGEMDPAGEPLSQPRYRPQSPGSFYDTDQIPLGATTRGFSANVNYSLTRQRPRDDGLEQPSRQNIGFGTTFAPTPFWGVSWQTQYNVTDKQFESHVVRLERNLHEWRAAFNFVRNANGNVAFYFSVYLTDLPELKLDFNQSTLD
ncbi:MAG TPA: twin-arginine translocase subunit TatC [Gemmatimonadales bacterium]|nr:twin-arginine translocase subunit TatC [Gemmatimonadales bacterium]